MSIPAREELTAILRNTTKGKIDFITVRGGWREPLVPQPPDTPEGKTAMKIMDSFILRQWTLKYSGQSRSRFANVKQIIMTKTELLALKKAIDTLLAPAPTEKKSA